MSFTSDFFLIGFFPLFALLYILLRSRGVAARKALLLLANSLFYVWGGAGTFLLLCAFSILICFLAGIVYRNRSRGVLAVSILLSITPLILTKYTAFFIRTVNTLTGANAAAPSIVVPVGISFITFEAVALLVDTRKGVHTEKPALLDTYLFLSFFPTVTSGPILRYNEFERGLYASPAFCSYTAAIERIVIGLCKKVLIADKLAVLADFYFDGTALGSSYSCAGLWIGSIAYTLQLYFDFSGYSDMAIGIGALLGFDIRENFNKPYLADSISDFWKRWHISLTQWFRDYVYIPLGGNRCSRKRQIFNMLTVWLLTGIWHGAGLKFIFWGLAYFALLVVEKYTPQKLIRSSKILSHAYTLFFVNLLWVPFRAKNFTVAVRYLRGMFGGGGLIEGKAIRFLPMIALAIVLCLPWDRAFEKLRGRKWFSVLRGAVLIALTCLALAGSINATYAPYIYGNF